MCVCLKLWIREAVSFRYLRSISWQEVESRVESVLWQDDGRVALVEKVYYYLAEKR